MKRAQIWSLDLLVASAIFVLGLVFFYLYALNYAHESDDVLSFMRYDAERIADNILSTGYPTNWTENNVIMLGISDNNRINETKLAQLKSLADNNYERTRGLFATRYHWYLNFSEPMLLRNQSEDDDEDDDSASIEYIGRKSETPNNLFAVRRLTVYRNKPAVLNIRIWN